jgi:hypothetical protein
VGIKGKLLVPGLGVVKDSHFLFTHHHKLLLFKGVQPGNEYVGFEPGGKLQVRCGDIRNFLVQVVAARGQHAFGHFACKAENHGYVVGCKGPENVFLAPDFAQIKALGINVVNPSKLSVGCKLL